MSPRSTVRAAAAVAVTLLALSACGSSDPGEAADKNAATGASTTGPFVIAADAVTTTLEPGSYDGLAHRYAFDMLKGPLVRYVNTEDVAGGGLPTPEDVEPWLAESWEIQDDGIEFTLGEAVSPYGNPLTPEDVVYTLERIYATESSIGKSMLNIAGVDPDNPATVTGENTVKVNADVNYLSLFVFETYWLAPLDRLEIEKHATPDDPYGKEWLATNNAMFGAYTVGDGAGQFTPGEEIRYVANENYTREPLNYDSVVLQAVPEIAGRISLLQSGEASMIMNIPFENLKVLESDPNVTLQITSSGSQDVLALNNEVYSDVRVRQALSYAIDREGLIAGAYQGFGDPSTSVVSTEIPAINSTADAFEFDPERARELLEEAGAVGQEMTIYANSTEMAGGADALLTALQQQLTAVGLNVSVQLVPSNADFRAGYGGGQYAAWIRTEGPLAADPVYLFDLYYIEGAASNFGKVNVPELNDAVEAAKPLSGKARQEAVAPGIKAANEQQVSVPLVQTVSGFGYAAGICHAPTNRSFPLYPAQATTC